MNNAATRPARALAAIVAAKGSAEIFRKDGTVATVVDAYTRDGVTSVALWTGETCSDGEPYTDTFEVPAAYLVTLAA
jgi:hypothetical protein